MSEEEKSALSGSFEDAYEWFIKHVVPTKTKSKELTEKDKLHQMAEMMAEMTGGTVDGSVVSFGKEFADYFTNYLKEKEKNDIIEEDNNIEK